MPAATCFVWQLRPILAVDGGPDGMAQKAVNAKCLGVWIKVAVGQQEYDKNAPVLPDVLTAGSAETLERADEPATHLMSEVFGPAKAGPYCTFPCDSTTRRAW